MRKGFCENCEATTIHHDITLELKDGTTVKGVECEDCEEQTVFWSTRI